MVRANLTQKLPYEPGREGDRQSSNKLEADRCEPRAASGRNDDCARKKRPDGAVRRRNIDPVVVREEQTLRELYMTCPQ